MALKKKPEKKEEAQYCLLFVFYQNLRERLRASEFSFDQDWDHVDLLFQSIAGL